MNFVDSVRTCFVKYADCNGRASRSEFWWFALFLFVAGLATGFIHDKLNLAFSVATLLPSFSAGARRLHDVGRSGWWQLILLVPVIGWILLIVWLAQPSVPDSNYD